MSTAQDQWQVGHTSLNGREQCVPASVFGLKLKLMVPSRMQLKPLAAQLVAPPQLITLRQDAALIDVVSPLPLF